MEVEAGKKLIREYEAMQPYILSEFTKDKETGETIQQGGCILKLIYLIIGIAIEVCYQ